MPDTQRLRNVIQQRGMRVGHIATELGITRQAFSLKMQGKTEFRVSEIQKLSNLLGLSLEERDKIFFNQDVELKSTQVGWR